MPLSHLAPSYLSVWPTIETKASGISEQEVLLASEPVWGGSVELNTDISWYGNTLEVVAAMTWSEVAPPLL